MRYHTMHLKKYFCYTFVLILFCRCTDGCKNKSYIYEEEEGYYTQNSYKLGLLDSLEEAFILSTPDTITDWSQKLAKRNPEWRITGTESEPYTLWNDFFTKEITVTIVAKLKKERDTTLLENCYDAFGNLLRATTKDNEQALIAAIKKVQADAKLMQAFKACIKAHYNNPGSILLTKEKLAYNRFICFISETYDSLLSKLQRCQANIKKWHTDCHTNGQTLWEKIKQTHQKELACSTLYKYKKNQEAIVQSLKIIDQLADQLYNLSYKDLLETLPHGIKLFNDIVYEVGLEAKDSKDIQALTIYLRLVSNLHT
ncbi:hypothetical protein CE557_090 [Cardinium endosymbiont of Sogatella furcifera]|uniref:hypothetical protein n=1 Tax=Cardinium endosymbiont of Sogatella furcifera TaxID=650378 RepID=UPI000E104EFB|nr:hypothetical protein [Cardinium endosymbiont of Sogatella furcifera]AXI23934.1 hypothetical protein CE557_090 [Cardinium endosymbiont of Sogatella furcifera]